MNMQRRAAATKEAGVLEFMSDAWLHMVRGLLVQYVSRAGVAGPAEVCIAERFFDAPTPTGEDGWYVIVAGGRVTRFGRGRPPTEPDLVNEISFANAARSAVDPSAREGGRPVSRLGPSADLAALQEIATAFEGLHEAIARRTAAP